MPPATLEDRLLLRGSSGKLSEQLELALVLGIGILALGVLAYTALAALLCLPRSPTPRSQRRGEERGLLMAGSGSHAAAFAGAWADAHTLQLPSELEAQIVSGGVVQLRRRHAWNASTARLAALAECGWQLSVGDYVRRRRELGGEVLPPPLAGLAVGERRFFHGSGGSTAAGEASAVSVGAVSAEATALWAALRAPQRTDLARITGDFDGRTLLLSETGASMLTLTALAAVAHYDGCERERNVRRDSGGRRRQLRLLLICPAGAGTGGEAEWRDAVRNWLGWHVW